MHPATVPSAETLAIVSDGMLTVKDAQKKYRLSRDRIRALMRDGTFHFAILDERGTRAIPEREVAAYVAALIQNGAGART